MVKNGLVGLIVCDKSCSIRLFAVGIASYRLWIVATKHLNTGSCKPTTL